MGITRQQGKTMLTGDGCNPHVIFRDGASLPAQVKLYSRIEDRRFGITGQYLDRFAEFIKASKVLLDAR